MELIRKIHKQDLPALKQVLNTIDLFPAEMLDDMAADFIDNPASEDIWFTATHAGNAIALAYCAPEKLTVGTYNLYAIGVKADIQGQGIGERMMTFIENHLRANGHRLLIVDTSGTENFEATRKFYEKLNYNREAVIQDFWYEGDDKVIFTKKLK